MSSNYFKMSNLNVEKLSLGSRLAQKSKEVSDFQNQVIVMNAAGARAESKILALTEDARLLKLEVKRLTSENDGVVRGLNLFEDLQGDVCRLEKELMKEKLRSKALESELENPHNIHRWRRLVGSDPKTYDLIQKVHFLQKRLIVKTEEVVKAKSAISRDRGDKNVDDLYKIDLESKGSNLRASSCSALPDKMLEFQQNFRDKDKQIKSLTAEQSVYLSELEKSKSTIQALTLELREAKYSLLILRKSQENNKSNLSGRTLSHQERRATVCGPEVRGRQTAGVIFRPTN